MDDNSSKGLKKIGLLSIFSLISLPVFIFFVVIFTAAMFLLGFFENNLFDFDIDFGGDAVATSSGSECGFTIKATSLSKKEYINALKNYSKSNSINSNFVDRAGDIYDVAKSMNLNPELVIVRAVAEGRASQNRSDNNYWGLGSYNGSGNNIQYNDGFMSGVKGFLDNISQYDSLQSMMFKYAVLERWYNPGGDDLGGCAYADDIYGDNMPDRVKKACAKGNECSGNNCLNVLDEEQSAYAKWQVEKNMATIRKRIFGLALNEGVSCNSTVEGVSTDVGSIVVTSTNILSSDVSSFLKSKGSSLEKYNSNIYSSVKKAGLGTRNGVAAAAIAMIDPMFINYKYTFKYTWGGKYDGYGLKPTIGSSGLDCSGFVSWAIHNGGFKYNYNTSGGWKEVGSSCRITDSSCLGKPGDLIWHSGHIMLIVGVDSSNYYVAEANSTNVGIRITKQGLHSDSYGADYIVDMTKYYSNNVQKDGYPS